MTVQLLPFYSCFACLNKVLPVCFCDKISVIVSTCYHISTVFWWSGWRPHHYVKKWMQSLKTVEPSTSFDLVLEEWNKNEKETIHLYILRYKGACSICMPKSTWCKLHICTKLHRVFHDSCILSVKWFLLVILNAHLIMIKSINIEDIATNVLNHCDL